MRQPLFLVVCASAMLAPVEARAVPIATFVGLGTPPGSTASSLAYGVCDDGTVIVGTQSASRYGTGEPFRWTPAEGRVVVGDLPGGASAGGATGVSSDGSVVVGGSGVSNGVHAFRWTAGAGMEDLGILPGGSSQVSSARAVSDDGAIVVGQSTSAAGDSEAFRWSAAEGMVGLGGLPGSPVFSSAEGVSADGSVIVGWSHGEAFRWTPDSGMVGLGVLPGGASSRAVDTSADGSVVVGTAVAPPGYSQLFLWTAEEGMVGIGPLGSVSVFGASADASIIVGFSAGHATAWDLNLGPEAHDIQKVLTEEYGLDLTGWQLEYATDVSSDGRTLVGFGINPTGQREAWRATIPLLVPEPGTLALLAFGLGALASISSRRARAR